MGVDPGTHVVGWGVIELDGARPRLVASGAITARPRDPVPAKLAAVADGLAELVRMHRPDAAAVEKAFFGKNATAALRIGEARGAVLAELARAGVPVEEVTPAEVKKAVTGTGAAHKRQVQMMTAAILGLREPETRLDVTDALAAAICLAHRVGVAKDGRRR